MTNRERAIDATPDSSHFPNGQAYWAVVRKIEAALDASRHEQIVRAVNAERRLTFCLLHLGNVEVTVGDEMKTLREWCS